MRYLLDTCAVSDFARGDRPTLARIKSTPPADIVVSSVTAMEVFFGLALDEARARAIAPALRGLLDAVDVLPYETSDAQATATLRAALQKRGRPIGAYDGLIAGSALARGLILVTSNETELRRVGGLKIENWRKS